jgi:hypothetical protein|tara:strand:+ start:16158 stop:16406 length:249 start_codon:yes stop_codon:yes gene_type:complete
MKTKLALVLLAVLATGCSGDGMFTTPSTGDLMVPDATYELDTWGFNSELYEFTPKTAPNMTCIMFMLDNGKAMGLQCFPKVK